MKAGIYHGIEDMRIEEVDTPSCGEGEIRIKTHYCAICGTDVRIYFHGHKKVIPPAIIGHEITGVVDSIGPRADCQGIKEGDKVALVTSIGCGSCKMCGKKLYNLCPDTKAIGYFYPGGYAEYVVVPENAVKQKAVIKLPENISLKEGALIEALSCCINGQGYLGIGSGDTVLIYGGGPIGLLHAVLAQASGAERVVVADPGFERLKQFGSHFEGLILLDPAAVSIKDEIRNMTSGYGADVVITACPAKQAQVEGMEILGSHGRISLFGGLPKDDSSVTFDANLIHYKELSVFGAFASNRKDYEKAAALISGRQIAAEKFISAVIPIEELSKGIGMVKQGNVLKCIVETGG